MISVITVCFNSGKTILETLHSVFDQKDVEIEHIIIDGMSKDQTFEIVKTFVKEHQKPTLTYQLIQEKDQGMYDAINKGLKLVNGDYVGILNSDDTYANDHVLKTIQTTFQKESIDAVYGYVDVYDGSKIIRKIRNGMFQLGDYQKSKHPAHPTFYVRKDIIKKYGEYDLSYKIASDGEYMFRLLEIHQIKHRLIKEVLVHMKDGGMSQRGLKSTLQIIKDTKKFMKKHKQRFSILVYVFHKVRKIKEYRHE
jgi:glycosyltransferase involved in cell wall biosynthesis